MLSRWLEHYDANVPKSLGSYGEATLVDIVRRHAAHADTTAVVFKGRRLSYADLDRASDALAHALDSRGVKQGDRVALLIPNSPQFIVAELAAWKVGALIAPQNLLYVDRELTESLAATGAEIIVTLSSYYHQVKRCQPGSGIQRVIVTNIKEYLPRTLSILFTLFKEKKEGHRVSLEGDDEWFQGLIEEGVATGPFTSVAKPGDDAVVLMSGGTTGTPKAALGDHRSFVMSGTQLAHWLEEPLGGPDASLMLPLPLFHTYGCLGAQSLAMVAGIPLILIPNPRDMDDLLGTIDSQRPALLCAVPTMFIAMMNHPRVTKTDFSSLKACFSGAAALGAETKRRFESMTGARIVEGYSLTEAMMACCANPFGGENKIGSIGMPLPDVRVRIFDPESPVNELADGEIGEVAVSAPQLMLRYWNDPEETAIALRDLEDGRWLYTGDLGYIDPDGYIFLIDRKKDLIKTSGFQVWPREIEEVLMTHPSVAEAGVAGLPHPQKGEAVAAWVVQRADTAAIDPVELKKFCRESLAPYKVPVTIEIRKELPKTMIGKVLRRALVAEAKAAMAHS